MPPILSTSHCEFNDAGSCAHARKTIPLTFYSLVHYTNSTFMVSTIISQQLVQIFGHYKGLPSMNNTFTRALFFSNSNFHFHRTLFRGLAGAYVNPGIFSLFVHSLVCPITHSSLDGFQPNLVQHFPHVCSTCHTVFSLKNTFECVCERLLHCRLIFPITWTPGK